MVSTPSRSICLGLLASIITPILTTLPAKAQDVKRPRPAGWENLVYGGRFMDRFKPVPLRGKLTSDTWGIDAVKPRDVANGIEDDTWSYWGGNIKFINGKYHLFVCRWLEDSPNGHRTWPRSIVVRAVSDHPLGPYKVTEDEIGKGHNPEIFQAKDGSYAIALKGGGYYHAPSINGPWKLKKLQFNKRDRRIVQKLSNLTFAPREDGSVVMVCRGGGIWISETGLSPYEQIGTGSVYPKVKGNFEDPVVWKTNVQYHLIVNDWKGRIAYYLRSKNGLDWKVDDGEAYTVGFDRYEDGTLVDWYKFERIKILQDSYGRATQANFAVIDYSKWKDLSNDNHSSKNACIPLTVGRLLTVLNDKKITAKSNTIKVKIHAEPNFDPLKDVDITSLRFGASEEINYGRGAKVLSSAPDGKDLIVTFSGEGNGLTDDHFAGKMLGKTSSGKLLFGYSRLPGVDYDSPILTSAKPKFLNKTKPHEAQIEIKNHSLKPSSPAKIKWVIEQKDNSASPWTLESECPAVNTYKTHPVNVSLPKELDLSKPHRFTITTPTQKTPVYKSQ